MFFVKVWYTSFLILFFWIFCYEEIVLYDCGIWYYCMQRFFSLCDKKLLEFQEYVLTDNSTKYDVHPPALGWNKDDHVMSQSVCWYIYINNVNKCIWHQNMYDVYVLFFMILLNGFSCCMEQYQVKELRLLCNWSMTLR